MRRPTWLLLLALVPLLAAQAARPDGTPLGRWTIDEAALRTAFRQIMEADLADMPDHQRQQTRAVLDGRLEEMVHRAAGTAEFRADGTARFTDYAGEAQAGRWAAGSEGFRVRLDDGSAYRGEVADNRLTLVPDGDDGPPLQLRRTAP